jgi:hypothetical protein
VRTWHPRAEVRGQERMNIAALSLSCGTDYLPHSLIHLHHQPEFEATLSISLVRARHLCGYALSPERSGPAVAPSSTSSGVTSAHTKLSPALASMPSYPITALSTRFATLHGGRPAHPHVVRPADCSACTSVEHTASTPLSHHWPQSD